MARGKGAKTAKRVKSAKACARKPYSTALGLQASVVGERRGSEARMPGKGSSLGSAVDSVGLRGWG